MISLIWFAFFLTEQWIHTFIDLLFHSWLKRQQKLTWSLNLAISRPHSRFYREGKCSCCGICLSCLALYNSFSSFPSWFLLCQSPEAGGWWVTQKERENTWEEPLAQVCLRGSCCSGWCPEPVQSLSVTSGVSRGHRQDRKHCWHRAVEKFRREF